MRYHNKNLLNPLNLLLLLFLSIGLFQLFTFSTDSDEDKKQHASKMHEVYKIFSLSPPQQITFANEAVPLEEPEVYERLDRELHANTYFHSNTILYFKKANRWFPIIEPILKKNNIPDDFKYLALVESGLQNVVSPAGATGYWQFLEKTAREFGLEVSNEVDERYHIEKSTEAACKYLNAAHEKYNDWALVAASYNVGMQKVSKELKRQQANSYYDLLLNNETGRYVFRILAIKQIFEQPTQYGFNIRKNDLYQPLNYKVIEINKPVENFADFAKEKNISYKILKHFNPWLRQAYLKNTANKTYSIKLPTDANYELN